MSQDLLIAARAEALFVSDVSASAPLSLAVATVAIRNAVRTHGGVRGCAADVAAEYGDHPETACPRMRWARATVEKLYGHHPPPAHLHTSPARTLAGAR